MRVTNFLASAVVFTVAAYGVAVAAAAMPTGVKMAGGMLTDAKGMTLYTWDNDKEANKSACEGNCLNNWPVLKAEAADKDTGDWKVITRGDGSKQWAYKGKPLYLYSLDHVMGDTAGDKRGNAWHAVRSGM